MRKRIGINPRTGEKIKIAARKRAAFSFSQQITIYFFLLRTMLRGFWGIEKIGKRLRQVKRCCWGCNVCRCCCRYQVYCLEIQFYQHYKSGDLLYA